MKRVLITGTSGYIATSLKKWLSQYPERFDVHCISLRGENWKTDSFASYDTVVHTAGLAHQTASTGISTEHYRINRDLTISVAEKARLDGVAQFVFLSSMSVYGMEEGSISSDTVPVPVSDYGKSKLEAENLLRAMETESFRVAVLRPPMVYGPGCPGNYQSLAKLALKLPYFPKLTNRRSMVFIDTLCDCIRQVIETEHSGLIFPQDPEYICTSDMAELVAAAHGKNLCTAKSLTPFALFAARFIPKAKKAFGSLIYDSTLLREVQAIPLWERIFRAEQINATAVEFPLISVVMPAYNAEHCIGDAIQSVLSQTYPNFELIVVDDCAQDQTAAIVQAFADTDDRIMFLRNQQNSGASVSRNRAIAAAKGEWIAFLDSDDMWRADKLEQQVRFLRYHPEARLLYTASAFMDEQGNRFSHVMQAKPLTTRSLLLKGNIISCSSVLVRKEDMLKHPMAGDRMHEDYVTWLQILEETPYAYGINEPLLIYRLSSTSKSSNRITSAKMLYRSYRHVGYSSLHTVFMVFRYTLYSIRKRKKITRM